MLGNRKHIVALLALLAAALLSVGSASAAPISSDSLGVNVLPFHISGGRLGPSDLSIGSSSGLGTVRIEAIEGGNSDAAVTMAAAAHLRVSPMLGLPQQLSPSAAASAMAQYVSSFASRYGPGGTFWSQNPQLPYLPIQDYEIGNEPNIPVQYVEDNVNLHWADPSSYAQVYEAARTALHQVDPTGVAEVGGLADSATPGVSLVDDEHLLAALTPGQVDAVGYHPYTFPVSFTQMNADTEGLRQWMDANGMQNVPIDINEVGACDVLPQDIYNVIGCAPSISSSDWGTFVAAFTEWSLCSTALNVGQVQPFSWGDLSTTDQDAVLSLVSTNGTPTPYGQHYLAEAQTLTSSGCSLSNTSSPTVTGNAVVGQSLNASAGSWSPAAQSVAYQWERCDSTDLCTYIAGATSATYQVQSADLGSTLIASVTATGSGGDVVAWSAHTGVVSAAPSPGGSGPPPTSPPPPPSGGGGTPPVAVVASAGLQILSAHAHGPRLTVVVRVTPGWRRVTVVAKKGHHTVHLRLSHHNGPKTVLTFTAKLSGGRWKVSAACTPSAGVAAPRPQSRKVTIP